MNINSATSQMDHHLTDDIQEISVSSTAPASALVPNHSLEGTSEGIDNIPKTIRDKFYSDIVVHDKNWSAKCILCDKLQYDNKGVSSNIIRHIKNQHKKEYEQWSMQLRQLNNTNQKKISDMFAKNDDPTKSTSSKSHYHSNHPRQVQLSQAIVSNLILDLGLPLSLVERQSFINFMNLIDPKFTITSRRTLSRSIIPRLFDKMNTELKRFCDEVDFISLTLDIWTDRRMRAFYAMTGKFRNFLDISIFNGGAIRCFFSYSCFRTWIYK